MKIAIVHDYLIQYGGAERVLEALCEIWPHAPIYTLIHDSKKVHERFSDKRVKTSFLQNIPFTKNNHRIFPPLMMLAIEQFNFDYYDIVISDSSSFAKNIITNPSTLHISYCHTPMRYAWDDCQYYTQEFGFPKLLKKFIPFFMNYIRNWDYIATSSVDSFIANSNFVNGRIKKYYNRSAKTIHPPVEVDNFYISPEDQLGDYFLMVGRMMKYKKMDTVIEAFNKLGLPLKIVSRGPEFKNLKKIAGNNIEFTGRVSEKKLQEIYSKAQAFIFPQEEDFGIVAIEALASGRPIIAFRSGDIVEHIEEGRSGLFFDNQNKEDIIKAVKKFQKIKFNSNFIRSSALKFNKKYFKNKIKGFVEEEYRNFNK
ncbi:MAG: glycosyltransferase [Patescibacteria group bacterium]|jgi:glycosyltransferase involved in cell wall biosynthesis|nr:glycosyltransferase [Patescibacteria group bacterium]